MRAGRTTLGLALAANLALCANAAAPMRVAVVSPTVTPDQLESPHPSASVPPLHNVPQPEPNVAPARPRAPVANEPRGNPLWGIPLKSLSIMRSGRCSHHRGVRQRRLSPMSSRRGRWLPRRRR